MATKTFVPDRLNVKSAWAPPMFKVDGAEVHESTTVMFDEPTPDETHT
jgi:hypothetical protein